MLRSMNDLKDYTMHATDGNIGHVKDFYFDDKTWTIRYLIVDTGNWLSNRKVLISPIAIRIPNWRERVLPVSITKDQVKNSPDIDTDMPVSRQHEVEFQEYYNYPSYWSGAGLWGGETYPSLAITASDVESMAPAALQKPSEHRDDNPHLQSCLAVLGYAIEATDGEIGQVTGFLVDEDSWVIRYMIVEAGNWWQGHQVLVVPEWIDSVSWLEAKVSIKLTRQAVKDAPPYDRTEIVDREQEEDIYRHYGRPGYWLQSGERELVLSPD
jgi:uncharacterized protein YrrD